MSILDKSLLDKKEYAIAGNCAKEAGAVVVAGKSSNLLPLDPNLQT